MGNEKKCYQKNREKEEIYPIIKAVLDLNFIYNSKNPNDWKKVMKEKITQYFTIKMMRDVGTWTVIQLELIYLEDNPFRKT